VQSAGKLPLDVKAAPISYLALSGHKLHAPKGVGALYVQRKAPFIPHILGAHQEHGRRAGTENTASIIALGKACELATLHMHEESTLIRGMRDRLEEGLLNAIPDCIISGDMENRLPNTSSIAFKHVEGEAILLMLDRLGICASSGSACSSGSLEPSHVLRAMNAPLAFVHGAIRFSLSRFNTGADVELAISELPGIISRLRAMSPFYSQGNAG
jgi:cysteine desulfurase